MQRCKKCQKPYLSCCGDTSAYCFDCQPREKGTCAIEPPKTAAAKKEVNPYG